jgi:hypothetical protein
MRFNLIFNFHKHSDWQKFYFEYNELKEYLKNASDFFRKEIEIKCKKHPSNFDLRKMIEKKRDCDNNKNGIINNNAVHDQELCLYNKSVNFPEFEIQTEYKQFSVDFIYKLKETLKKVEKFFLEAKNDLNDDFEVLKHLVLECEDIEVK